MHAALTPTIPPPSPRLRRRRTQPRKADQKSADRRSSDVVPRLRRFRGARALLQADREAQDLPHEKIVTVAGHRLLVALPVFRASARRALHPRRALPLASGVSLSRPDLHVFVFGGDGDAFSIGGNHFNHTARKNIKMTYVIMDNFVYGLTKKQTSPTSPIGFKSKTDPDGRDRPAGQPDEAADRRRRDFRRPHARHAGQPHDRDDGARDGSRRLLGHRVPQRVRRVLPRRLRRGAIPRKGGAFR